MSSTPPSNSSAFDAPEERPRLPQMELHYLRIWHESASIQEAAPKAGIEIRTMQNFLQSCRFLLKVRDDVELREYIKRNGWPEPYPACPPPPPPTPAHFEHLAQRKQAIEKLMMLAEPSRENCQKLGLDHNLIHNSPDAYNQEWLRWSDDWPGGKFLPQSPDEALLALLLRREFRDGEMFDHGPGLLITLASTDPRFDAEARGRIFWALELEPDFAYWITPHAPLPQLPSQIDPRFLRGGAESPRIRLRPPRGDIYTDLPYIFPNGVQCPTPLQHATWQKSGQGRPPPRHSHFSFSIDEWDGPDEVKVSLGYHHGPLAGHGYTACLHRNGDSWRTEKTINDWVA